MCEFCFSSINQETEFCIQNVEKTNRCQRLSYKLIKTNSERNLTLCKEIKDGTWSSWTEMEVCKGTQKVEGVEGARCGEGKRRDALLYFLTNVFIAKVINVERDTALELWVGNSARMMGPTTEHNS